MGLGQMRTATQSLSDEEVELLAAEVGREVTIKHASDEEEEAPIFDDAEEALVAAPAGRHDHGPRRPRQDDAARRDPQDRRRRRPRPAGSRSTSAPTRPTSTAARSPSSTRRATRRSPRCAPAARRSTDIAVLVVAADDGVMPQTRESISHARAAEVPIVVAVNKIDLPDANPDRVLAELAAEGLQPEEWGGDVAGLARLGQARATGLDDLLERILLVADAELDLRANPNAEASGPMIESRLDVGRGPVATMLVQRGTLQRRRRDRRRRRLGPRPRAVRLPRREGQGGEAGRAGRGRRLRQAAAVGRARARRRERARAPAQLANSRGERLRREQLATQSRRGVSLEGLFAQMEAGGVQDLNLVLKGDVQGSVEAAVSELAKIEHSEVRVNVIHTGVGGITENDINLAAASDALVVGFNVRPNAEARQLAEREGVEIRTYRVIYQLTEEIEQALVGMLSAVTTEETIGEAEVRALFKVSRLGTIAGCMVTSGVVRRNAQVRVVRDGTVIDETTIAQLQRFKDDVARGAGGLRVRHPARGLQRRAGGRRLRGVRDARGRADDARRAGPRPTPPRQPTTRRVVPAGYVGDPLGGAALPREPLAEGEAPLPALGEGSGCRSMGAAVAEVDHHDVWQRSRLTVAVRRARVPRGSSGCSTRRSATWLGRNGSSDSCERQVVEPDE